MTVQPTRDQLRAEAIENAPHGMIVGTGEMLALLDQLDQAEATVRRQERYIEELESVDAVGLKARAQQAEARIRAVRDLCDDADKRHASVLIVTKVRRALDG